MQIEKIRPLFTHEEIETRVAGLATRLNALYKDEPLVAVCVLKGAVVFFADLVRHIDNSNITLDFVRLSTYRESMNPGEIAFLRDLDSDIAGKHVLVVEDVVDSGRTTAFLLEMLRARGPKSLRLVSLVDKRARREADLQVDFACFDLDQGFIVGYGLDYAERYRALPDICVVETTSPNGVDRA